MPTIAFLLLIPLVVVLIVTDSYWTLAALAVGSWWLFGPSMAQLRNEREDALRRRQEEERAQAERVKQYLRGRD